MSTQAPSINMKALGETVEAVKANPKLGNLTFAMHSKSAGGIKVRSTIGSLTQAGSVDNSRVDKFSLDSDEPVLLLGEDSAVSPSEYVLKALAGCYGVTLTALAAEANIPLNGFELDLEFEIDLNGFLQLDKSVRPGAKQIRVAVSVDSPGTSPEDIKALVDKLQQRSPIRDTLANPVEVVTSVK